MRPRLLLRGLRVLLLGAYCWLSGAPAALAAITAGGPLRVGILYDNSGSMYPGYAPPGRQVMPRAASGARLFHQHPEFQQWLADFVFHQTLLDAGTVSMSTSTSTGDFAPGDLRQVHPELPVERFDVARALRGFPSKAGQATYLTESLDRFTRGFEGFVWLITDNIVETRAGVINADVRRFFETLRDVPRYRSVHLFKYPFRDERAGQGAVLAVYGILVSEAEVPEAVLAHYDRKLGSSFRFADRRGGDPPAPLFPGREHLKLKNLEVDALELQAVPNLQVTLDDPDKGLFEEGQLVQLELAGRIRSYLTQHSVVGGRYQLEFAGDFEPESWAARELGAQRLPPTLFQTARGQLGDPIPPNQTRDIKATSRSLRPLSFANPGPGGWMRLALRGAVIRYSGPVRMSFEGVEVHLERAQMAGVFGIDEASSIFDFQDVQSIDVAPSEATVSFVLKSGAGRTALLFLLLSLLAGLLGTATLILTRRRWYRIRISGTPEKLVPLRRLGAYPIVHDGQSLGRLSRGLSGAYSFTPNAHSAAFAITPTRQPDTYDVRFRDGRGCQLSVEPQGTGGRLRGKPHPSPPPPRPLAGGAPTPGPAPTRALPKIDRP